MTVLLAEDQCYLRRLYRAALEAEGLGVTEAPDGVAALALAEAHPGPIELLVSDVRRGDRRGMCCCSSRSPYSISSNARGR